MVALDLIMKLYDPPDNSYPLHSAVSAGDLIIVRRLLAEGAGPNEEDRYGYVPLFVAIFDGASLDCIHVLLSAGADPNGPGPTLPPLVEAANQGRTDVGEVLLAAGADPNQPNADDYTALITAASVGNVELVRILLEAGADPTRINRYGETALDGAREGGHAAVVDILRAALKRAEQRVDPL